MVTDQHLYPLCTTGGPDKAGGAVGQPGHWATAWTLVTQCQPSLDRESRQERKACSGKPLRFQGSFVTKQSLACLDWHCQRLCPYSAMPTLYRSPGLTHSVFIWLQFLIKSPFTVALVRCPRNFSQSFAWLAYISLGGYLFSLGSVMRSLLITSLFSLLVPQENGMASGHQPLLSLGFGSGFKREMFSVQFNQNKPGEHELVYLSLTNGKSIRL